MGRTLPRRKLVRNLCIDRSCNRTLNTHTVSVNGFLYSVVPGRAKIGIPIDTASVYLPLNESPKQWGLDHWRWTGQNYEMLIVIGN